MMFRFGLLAATVSCALAFAPPTALPARAAAVAHGGARGRRTTLNMGFFDNAFKNEKFDEKPAGYGSGGASAKKTVEVTVMGQKRQAMAGMRLKDVVRGSPIKFNCENGQCGTCESKVNGRVTRVCVAKVPPGGCTVTRK